MSNRLSYSQIRMYTASSKRYKYHYIDKLREKTKSGALFFGTAFDKAIEAVLQNKDIDEKAIFDKLWTNQEINGRDVYLPDSIYVVYAASDFDSDLLTNEDINYLTDKLQSLLPNSYESGVTVLEAYETCAALKKQRAFKNFSEGHNKFLNLCNWTSMRRKGHLMLDAHREKILHKYKKILATQKKIDLDNGKGDTLIGYVDLIAEWEDGRTVVFDYKTSAMEYDENAVLTSMQLTLYSHALQIPTCGFIVFRKGLIKNRIKICPKCKYDGTGGRHKTCPNMLTSSKEFHSINIKEIRCSGEWIETIKPEVDIQVLIGDITPRVEELVLENVEAVNDGIHRGVFVCNPDSCNKPFPCPYVNLCLHGDMSNLEKVE